MEKLLKPDLTIRVGLSKLDLKEFDRLIRAYLNRTGKKAITDEFCFSIRVVDDEKKPTKKYYHLTFIHNLGYKNVIIKIDRSGKLIEDWKNGLIPWVKAREKMKENKYQYCPVNRFQKIKSINEIL